jgi:hypothetical protein
MADAFLQQVTDWKKAPMDAAAALSVLEKRLPEFSRRLKTLARVRTAAGLP